MSFQNPETLNPGSTVRLAQSALVLLLVLATGIVRADVEWKATDCPAIEYGTDARTAPRPLRIHVLRVDLRNADYDVVSLIGDDPDGAGPAESQLVAPADLATRGGAVAAVNANAFGLTGEARKRQEEIQRKSGRMEWPAGGPVDILGWAEADGRVASPPQKGNFSLWIDAQRSVHIYDLGERKEARYAIAGFGGLTQGGSAQVDPGGPLHPRSAAGLNAEGDRLLLVVVDGRQAGYSEGMTTRELADLMVELGCRDSINLDGGGSSVMLLADATGALRIMNKPSGGEARPVPVMIGIRARKP